MRDEQKNLITPKPTIDRTFVIADTFLHELWLVFQRFALISLQLVCQFGVVAVGTVMVGQLPNSAILLSGVGLAKTFVNVTGTAMAWGMTTALFTLIPQAIGAGHINHAIIHTQRAFYICTIISALLSIIQFFAGDLLIYMGQPSELKPIINTFCRLLIPYIFFTSYCAILSRLSQTLNYNTQLSYCAIIMLCSTFPINYLFMYTLNCGYYGAAIGQSLSYLLNFICIVIMLSYKGHAEVFIPITIRQIWIKRGVFDYIKLSIPGLFQNAFEFIIEEIAIILAGYVVNPSISLSTSVIFSNIFIINMAFCVASANATNLRVGKYIGKGHINSAKRAAKSGMLIALIVAMIYCVIFHFGRDVLPKIYTNNVFTIHLADQLFWIFMLFAIGSIFLQTIGGIYRGLGFQRYSAIVVFISYWIVSFPICIILLFVYPKYKHNLLMGTGTIWGSLAFGNICGGIITFFMMICCLDWNNAIQESLARIKNTTKHMNYLST